MTQNLESFHGRPASRRIVYLTADLVFLSRVQAAARQAGTTVAPAGDVASAIDLCRCEVAELVIVDLSAPGIDIFRLIEQLRETPSPPRIVAYAPHVHESKLAAATQAGCDLVLPRGQFAARLESLVGAGESP